MIGPRRRSAKLGEDDSVARRARRERRQALQLRLECLDVLFLREGRRIGERPDNRLVQGRSGFVELFRGPDRSAG